MSRPTSIKTAGSSLDDRQSSPVPRYLHFMSVILQLEAFFPAVPIPNYSCCFGYFN